MSYNYFIPLIHLGPPLGYTYYQFIPVEIIKDLIIGKNAELEIKRKVILNKKTLFEKSALIIYKNNKIVNNNSNKFEWKNINEPKNFSYIETQINLLSGIGFTTTSLPGFYVNYNSANQKNFMSCGVEKYGNPRVIMQMQEFGMWIDGYPAVNISHKNNTAYSLVIINPYKIQNKFTIEINNLKIKQNISVDALSVKKINFFDIIKIKEWSGQFYIHGKRRGIIYLINHAFNNSNTISTVEHGDPFRAEPTFQPRFQFLRSQIHKSLKKILN